jgi:hypothetical protein
MEDHADILNNNNSYVSVIREGADQELDEARLAVVTSPPHDPKTVAHYTNLASVLWVRFEGRDRSDRALLDEYVQVERRICTLCPSDHPNRARSCRQLAASLGIGFEQFGDNSLLKEAIVLQKEILSLTPTGHPD